MPILITERTYDGSIERIERLGLQGLLNEVRTILKDFTLLVTEQKDANGGAALRTILDDRFESAGGWEKKQTGAIDWRKCHSINGTMVCVGIEIQFSARSDLLAIDVHHLRKAIVQGVIDVGILVVPSDRLATFLTDRGPRFSDAERHVREARAEDLPLIIIALEHDGPGPALAKRKKAPSGTRKAK